MRSRLAVAVPAAPASPIGFPSNDELAALRAWYAGLSVRESVTRYLRSEKAKGQSARSMLTEVRRKLASFARSRHRFELLAVLQHPASERMARAKVVLATIEGLRGMQAPLPSITDPVADWLSGRAASALHRHGIRTLADLTVRVPRRRRWWTEIPGIGAMQANAIEAFFARHPDLTERARNLVVQRHAETAPWEQLVVPSELDGSQGRFRAPKATCVLRAGNDYDAVQAWLALHESGATQRAYRKEAERLILWAVVEKQVALSSLTTEDALEYRRFLRRPSARWIGPARPRTSPDWRPFQKALSPRSTAYALSVVNALYRWLMEQRYVLANPFAGVKAKGHEPAGPMDTGRAFNDHEWQLIRSVADSIEWTSRLSTEAAQRLRFILDFWYATGLRPSEIAEARLGAVHRDGDGDDWLAVVGKGRKRGLVALPLLATAALDRHLMERGLPVSRESWRPTTPLISSLHGNEAVTTPRVRAMLKHFFELAALGLEQSIPALARKLRTATPHWLRHTHATHALASGADLTTVRDNLRHASISTTSAYLHADAVKRARQMRDAFPLHARASPKPSAS